MDLPSLPSSVDNQACKDHLHNPLQTGEFDFDDCDS